MKNRRGLTLVETIIGLTVIAIAFYLLAAVFINLAPRTAQIEVIEKKTFLANEKIEEYLARPFGLAATGETAGAFSSGLDNYNFRVIVTQVASSDLNTPVAGPTDYKNITVRVWGGQVDPAATIEVISLLTTYEAN
ncbi:MAG: type II secretion system GspH family protein [Candidatus Margulisbacteria bacterium]|jgi:type II secretory pathway pseudopilin PulG|nr:type II secretion system GspH family protein [Candidatus Margulisiibacteriota bacterium]